MKRLFLSALTPVAILILLTPGRGETQLPPAKTVTLSQAGLPLSKALAEIQDQTHIKVTDLRNSDDPTLKLTVKNTPFWQALDQIADEIGASVAVLPLSRKINLVKRPPGVKPQISYSGPFRISLKRITLFNDVETTAHHARASVEVAWEPQVQPFFLETRPQNLVVKDDKNAILPFASLGSSNGGVDGRISLLFDDFPLPAPGRTVTRYGLIEGSLSATGPTKMLPFRFGSLEELAQAKPGAAIRQQTQDGITCWITKIILDKDHWTIQIRQTNPPGAEKLESFQSWLVNNQLILESKTGNRQLASTSYSNDSATEALISYHFEDKGAALRSKVENWNLVYTTPAAVVVTPIPFQFKNVPLP